MKTTHTPPEVHDMLNKTIRERDELERIMRFVRELAGAALDHAHPRNNASISEIWRVANDALGRLR